MSSVPATGAKKRIVVTGGSGVVGRIVIEKLLSYGHEILNVDQTPLDNPKVHTLKADLTDGAQAFNALSCHFQISEPFHEQLRTPDVVIHLAGTYAIISSGWYCGCGPCGQTWVCICGGLRYWTINACHKELMIRTFSYVRQSIACPSKPKATGICMM